MACCSCCGGICWLPAWGPQWPCPPWSWPCGTGCWGIMLEEEEDPAGEDSEEVEDT